jgi:predicted small secreted protein
MKNYVRYRTESLGLSASSLKLAVLKIQPILRSDSHSIFYIRRLIMIKRIFVTLLASLFLAGTVVSLSGCNTMEGAGKDIEQGGKAIKDEAKENKN